MGVLFIKKDSMVNTLHTMHIVEFLIMYNVYYKGCKEILILSGKAWKVILFNSKHICSYQLPF